MSRIRRILHPTDFSKASSGAFKRAVDMAKGNRAELLLVHVLAPAVPVVADGYISPQVYEDMANATRAYGQKHLDALVRKAKQAGARVRGLLLEGIPHERIAQAARSRKADLVVIGTHGRTGFAKLFLGSVASRVLTVAPCPVLTVRGK
ncbi:MAG TPA: universal stress protein [Candidatus Deferrimicrobiaceae bacterium]|jgi:nucleotide-binding universal stress UspA family protein|nr:universal stress protein [Candidatus Deferrimicrobiaceae bacterium]